MVTREEINRAMAVHSLDDETRLHADASESEVVMTATGDLAHTDQPTSDMSGNGDLPSRDPKAEKTERDPKAEKTESVDEKA